MEFINNHIVSAVTFAPALFAVLLLLIPGEGESGKKLLKTAALAFSLVVFLLSCRLYTAFDATQAGFQFTEHHDWISAF